MHRHAASDAFGLLRSIGEGGDAAESARLEQSARTRFAVAQALAQGRIGFHFQPVVRADAPGFPAFHEMLARLNQPGGAVLPAAAFMPHVEAGPLGRAIDRLALRRAIDALSADPLLRLSVNLSPLSMGDADWLEILGSAAARDRRLTGRLILEITETAALEHCDQTLDFLNHARGFGCTLALDDFGAGATGFRHFRDFRFDMVKIDGSFVQGIHRSPDARVLVECLVAVARHFEMLVVAERVECPADMALLRGLGVDCLQGYLVGRPAARPGLPPAQTGEGRALAG
jgi:EAL domain-containing protein (putative c-di-GMP-specific phosphodiesterase class I)